MSKKIFTLLVLILVTACNQNYNRPMCPNAQIKRESAYLVQRSQVAEEFSIELIGYDGYCYYDDKIKHDKAVVTPIFRVKRLGPNSQTDVMFSYYTRTIKGPKEYLGTQTHFVKVLIPSDVNEVKYHGKQTELRIPAGMKYEYDIILGLSLSRNDYNYNQKTFDTNLDFISE